MKTEIIRDWQGHIVCIANAADGTVETKYGRLRVLTRIAVGESYCVERANSITWITRESETRFTSKSYPFVPSAG